MTEIIYNELLNFTNEKIIKFWDEFFLENEFFSFDSFRENFDEESIREEYIKIIEEELYQFDTTLPLVEIYEFVFNESPPVDNNEYEYEM
jgi:hypothetical protein